MGNPGQSDILLYSMQQTAYPSRRIPLAILYDIEARPWLQQEMGRSFQQQEVQTFWQAVRQAVRQAVWQAVWQAVQQAVWQAVRQAVRQAASRSIQQLARSASQIFPGIVIQNCGISSQAGRQARRRVVTKSRRQIYTGNQLGVLLRYFQKLSYKTAEYSCRLAGAQNIECRRVDRKLYSRMQRSLVERK